MPNDYSGQSVTVIQEPKLPPAFPRLPEAVLKRFPDVAEYHEEAERFWRRVRGSLIETTEDIARASETTSADLNNIVARLDNGDVASAIQNLSAAVGLDGAISTHIVDLQAKVGAASDAPNAGGSLYARVKSEEQARADKDAALAFDITALEATVTNNHTTLSTSISNEVTARTTADEALGSQITTLTSDYQNADATLQSQITTIATTYATQTFAETKKTEAISAAADDATAKVATEASARASADGAIHARWGVNIDNNGTIVGRVNLDGTNASSTFEVSADKFVVRNGVGSVTLVDIRASGIVFGTHIASDNFISGSAGWQLTRNGVFECSNGIFRGNITGGTIHIDDNGAVRIARCDFQNTYDQPTNTRTIGLELGYWTDVDAITFVDFHARPGVDNDARIIRMNGQHGDFEIEQSGNGDIYLKLNGAGWIKFGTWTADARYTIDGDLISDGYIQIKDKDGNFRKLLTAP